MGFTDLQVQEALENWDSLLVFRIDSAAGTVLALRDYIAALALEQPAWTGGRTLEAGNAPAPPEDVTPTIALLSLSLTALALLGWPWRSSYALLALLTVSSRLALLSYKMISQ